MFRFSSHVPAKQQPLAFANVIVAGIGVSTWRTLGREVTRAERVPVNRHVRILDDVGSEMRRIDRQLLSDIPLALYSREKSRGKTP